MTCRVCGTHNVKELGFSQGIYICNRCGSYSREHAVGYEFYQDNNYWFEGEEEKLKLLQKSYFVWFEGNVLLGDSIEFGSADGDFIHLINGFLNDLKKPIYKMVCPFNRVVYSELKNMLRSQYEMRGITKSIGTFDSFIGEGFSNVFMINTIEHLRMNLVSIMKKVNKMLVRKGRFFVITNDGDNFDAFEGLFKGREHNFIVTRKGFRIVNEHTGFRELKYYRTPYDSIIAIFEKEKDV